MLGYAKQVTDIHPFNDMIDRHSCEPMPVERQSHDQNAGPGRAPVHVTTMLYLFLRLGCLIRRMGTTNPVAGGWEGDCHITAAPLPGFEQVWGPQQTPPCSCEAPLHRDPHDLQLLPTQGPLCALHFGKSHACLLRLEVHGTSSRLHTLLVRARPPYCPSAQITLQQIPGLLGSHS